MIATHSTEILCEEDPQNVLVVDRTRRRSDFATALPAVQRVAESIGSAQNLHLTRLWSARRLILVEGKDVKFLKRFQDLLYPQSPMPIDGLPNMPIGGWNGWPYAVGSAMLLTNAGGEGIATYCILDSDYHTPTTIERRLAEATERNVELHIWRRKEIENYLIVPGAVARLIKARGGAVARRARSNDVLAAIDAATERLKDETIDAIAQEVFNEDRGRGVQNANREARARLERVWGERGGRVSIVSGKSLISTLSLWSQGTYGVSFGANALAMELTAQELDPEVASVLGAIERSARFGPR